MKPKTPFSILVACTTVILVFFPVSAQDLPLELYEVEPPEGQPGENLELRLLGRGFESAQILRVDIVDLEVQDFWVDSDKVLMAQVYIPEGTSPGPRSITVIGSFGENELLPAYLEAGFYVLEGEQDVNLDLFEAVPNQGQPGQSLELYLNGNGFESGEIVKVEIVDIQVENFWVDSGETIVAQVYIPEGISPGPRDVSVVVNLGENELTSAYLQAGFHVLDKEGESPPEPPTEDPPEPPGPPDVDFPWWILIVFLGFIGIALVVTVSVALALRQSGLKRAWQEQAHSQELPRDCQPSTYFNRRESMQLKPGRWKVASLKVTLFDAVSNKPGGKYLVKGDLVTRIDKIARQHLLTGMDDDLRRRISGCAKELSAQIIAWQANSGAEKDAYLQAGLEGGAAECTFARYQCVGQPGSWKKILEWTAELKAIDQWPETIRGPLARESRGAYQAYLESHLHEYLSSVIQECGKLI